MAWEPILWLIFLVINIALISLVIYQIVCLTDLEADYMNPYESSSRINSVYMANLELYKYATSLHTSAAMQPAALVFVKIEMLLSHLINKVQEVLLFWESLVTYISKIFTISEHSPAFLLLNFFLPVTGENEIYFNAGMRSFDVTGWCSDYFFWYEWVERSRTLMRSTTTTTAYPVYSHKVRSGEEWVSFILKEASSDKENRIWRRKFVEQDAEHFCNRKHKRFWRFLSIVSLSRGRGSVLIVPELAVNASWKDIAFKI
ncbi:Protein cornichon -like protein 1 [Capsicum annuum]|nr:Protein cornichon -like protein 1 [Capsicum annuum]